jgi:Co/Zn/Cd efflux system component
MILHAEDLEDHKCDDHNRFQGCGHEDHHDDHHDHHEGHTHMHGIVDPSIFTTERGIWAVKWSFVGLFITAFIQVIIVYSSGSIALLADTIHKSGHAITVFPLRFASKLAWCP